MSFETVNGERFTAVEPTPLLAACIDAAEQALTAAVAAVSPPVTVIARKRWEFGPGTELSPSLVVVPADQAGNGHGPHVPLLVVEFRTESTGRYVLGPKRMVYSRFRVPEFWYADPLNRRVAVLRAREAGDYEWPPEERAAGEVLEPRPLPGVSIAVDDLLGPSFKDGSRRRHADGGEEWLAS
jgi:Uma2 family endonuclease